MSAMVDRSSDAVVLKITDAAKAVVLEARQGEPNSDELALFVEVNGANDGLYTYDMWFQVARDAATSDAVQHHDDLVVVVASSSIDKMIGASLDVSDAGLVVINPNTPPSPRPTALAVPESDLSSPLELAVLEVLDNEVNPQIAAHGGRADLVAVDENNVAYLRLSGGCQGCGLAQVTLSQGISVAIKEAVPEIADIIDITAHSDGTNPYVEAAKK